jgi:hypothetical protein
MDMGLDIVAFSRIKFIEVMNDEDEWFEKYEKQY